MTTTPFYLPSYWPANNTNFPRATYECMPGQILKSWQYIAPNHIDLNIPFYNNITPSISFTATDNSHLYRFKGAFKIYATFVGTAFVAKIQESLNGGIFTDLSVQNKNANLTGAYHLMHLRFEKRYTPGDIVIIRLSLYAQDTAQLLPDSTFTVQQLWYPIDPTMQGVDSTTAWTFT